MLFLQFDPLCILLLRFASLSSTCRVKLHSFTSPLFVFRCICCVTCGSILYIVPNADLKRWIFMKCLRRCDGIESSHEDSCKRRDGDQFRNDLFFCEEGKRCSCIGQLPFCFCKTFLSTNCLQLSTKAYHFYSACREFFTAKYGYGLAKTFGYFILFMPSLVSYNTI